MLSLSLLPCGALPVLPCACHTCWRPVLTRKHTSLLLASRRLQRPRSCSAVAALPACSERAGVAGDTAVGGGARRRGGMRRTAASQVQVVFTGITGSHGTYVHCCANLGGQEGGGSLCRTSCPAGQHSHQVIAAALSHCAIAWALQGTAAGVLAQSPAAQSAGLQAAL